MNCCLFALALLINGGTKENSRQGSPRIPQGNGGNKRQIKIFRKLLFQAVVVHTFNPRTRKAEESGSLSSRPSWSIVEVPVPPGLHREILSLKQSENNSTIIITRVLLGAIWLRGWKGEASLPTLALLRLPPRDTSLGKFGVEL